MTATELSAVDEAIRDCAALYGVSPAIHPEDHIYNFVIQHPSFTTDAARVKYYFRDGAHSARTLCHIVGQHLPGRARMDLLEFACGYGCVSRHLVKMDRFDMDCCDIHEQAMDFLRDRIGARPVLSSPAPEALELPRSYDVAFALSFFSHMPRQSWGRWLARLSRAVRPGGILIFTTQGMPSRMHFGYPDIPESGFWFQPTSEQIDLSTAEYGQTIVMPSFVKAEIAAIPGLELLDLDEGYWWGHQDLYVVRRL
ncbi:bifunctional 2-polyprenyl-6-hydroxyphenol methylase/3-demethylubiquinol 3-O-methyltransferase UbiG [Roseococcus sp. SYP-B2431]|uniref:class I SAM-dependent methyltransferase n=1 Tax=Roseococcus sp. SYP-B2431 TaxID=2496640 RepID=UPI0013F44273|nr:class I SAM-dependent methyltransferase [Roseococcus sp. SYP-B2431]